MEQDSNQSNIMRIARFLFVWLCIGIPLGLFTMTLGPMRWLADYAHKTRMPSDKESFYGKLIVLGFVVITFLISILICRLVLKCGRRKNNKDKC